TAWAQRGASRLMNKDRDGARADSTRAIELDPTIADAWACRAVTRDSQDPEKALADNTRAIELDPRLAHAWGNRGIVRVRKGDLAGAISDLERALQLSPDGPGAATFRRELDYARKKMRQ